MSGSFWLNVWGVGVGSDPWKILGELEHRWDNPVVCIRGWEGYVIRLSRLQHEDTRLSSGSEPCLVKTRAFSYTGTRERK